MRVLVVQNSPTSGPRRLEGWLVDAGVALDVRLGSEGLPSSLDGFDGLVMLGGGLLPDEDDRAPWLRTERALASEALAGDVPTLGICLGAQVLAHVGGGEVRARYGEPENGATRITVTAEGAADAVLGALAPAAYLIENHEDRITRLPDDAVLLASSERCRVQAFRIGSHVRGVQFHPEVESADLARWDDAALAAKGISRAALIEEARVHDADARSRCRALTAAFAAEVRSASVV